MDQVQLVIGKAVSTCHGAVELQTPNAEHFVWNASFIMFRVSPFR